MDESTAAGNPAPTSDARGRAAADTPWVALCYHDVLGSTSASGGGPERFAVPRAAFDLMLDTIAEEGFAGCALEQAAKRHGERRVAITFDDATRSQFDQAMPALRQRGMTATVYVITGKVGTPGFMTWDELRTIASWGMSVQSHTHSHPFLSTLDGADLRRELVESKAILDRELSQDTEAIAFPGGDAPPASLRHIITEAGYRVAVGSRWGVNPPVPAPGAFARRCTIRGDLTARYARRVIHADPLLALSNHPREVMLRSMRFALGARRYASWRRRFLDAIAEALVGSRTD